MLSRSKYVFLPFICVLLTLHISCTSKEKYAGTYKAEGAETAGQAETYIELKENGEGAWRTGDEEVSFTWYLKGGELRLNTKEGGVIVGQIQDGTFQITLPGAMRMSFKKVE
ncbi:MAG: hypothetical protein PVG99_14775 [Desulfobacteraceae bacterium]